MKIAVALSSFYTAITLIFLIFHGYEIKRDVDWLVTDAQTEIKKGEVGKAVAVLNNLHTNLKQRHLTSGYLAAVIEIKSDNLSLYFSDVNLSIKQLSAIDGLSHYDSSYIETAYAVSVVLAELPKLMMKYLWAKYWFLYVGLSIWLWPINLSELEPATA